MPPVALFTIVFGAGLWAGLVLSVPIGVAVAGVAVAGVVAARRWWPGVLVAAALAGCATGVLTMRRQAQWCAASWSPGRHSAVVRLAEPVGQNGIARATIVSSRSGCGGPVRLRLLHTRLRAGQVLVVTGRGTGGFLNVSGFQAVDGARPLVDRLRDVIAARVEQLYGPRAGLVEALVLGRRQNIDPALRQRFADAGLAHLLAISGLHVGLIAAWLVLGIRWLGGAAGRWRWEIAAALTWAYVGLLGFPPAATRAAAFVSVHTLARRRQRRPPPGAVLAVAVLVVLAVDPTAAVQVGAWLSAAAVWGTATAWRLMGSGGRWKGGARALAASLGATLATAPITAFAFGSVAPIGIVTNLIAIPLAGVAVPAVFASLALGAVFARAGGLVLAAIERLAQLAAAVPWGHLAGTPGPAFAAPWLVVLAVAVWIMRRRPTWSVARRRLLIVGVGGIWAAVVAAFPAAGDRGLDVWVLNVGQGDAIAVRTPHGHWMLVDGGPHAPGNDAARRVVIPFLRAHGARMLDAVVASHGDGDHLGGLPEVLAAFSARVILEPGQPLGTPLYLRFLAAAAASGARWRAARAGDTLRLDGVTVAVLHPSARWERRELRTNENSVVLQVSYGRFDALLTGDAGWPAESLMLRRGRVHRVEVLKVGHHGSASATSEPWLERVAPKVAVVSVGAHNRYGHPAPVVLRRLRAHGVRVFRTDRGGTVTIRSDGRYFSVQQDASHSLSARLSCLVRRWLRSKASSSSKNVCTRRPPGSSRISFTTWPSPPRSSQPMSAAPGS